MFCHKMNCCHLPQDTQKSSIQNTDNKFIQSHFLPKAEQAGGLSQRSRSPQACTLICCSLVDRMSTLPEKKPPKLKLQARQLLDSNSLDWSSPAVLNLLIWGLSHSDKVSGLYPVKKKKKLSYILKKVSEILELFLESKQLCLCRLFLTQVSVLKSKEQCY